MDLNQDWREFVESLEENGVEYLLVGAVAGSFHGVPRMTGDIDFWVKPSDKNAAAVLRALDSFGFSGLDVTADELAAPDLVLQLGFPPRRIDLLTSLEALQFDECYSRRVQAEIGGLMIPVLSKEDFVRNKTALGRPKDLADVEAIKSD
jgi:hypothetical protein